MASLQLLRYVVLRHEGVAEPHFDLMFESAEGSPLQTWRSRQWPVVCAETVVRLPDHRREYLTLEGEIGGGRGHVRRVEAGRYELVEGGPAALTLALVERVPPVRLVLSEVAPGRWLIRRGEPA